ncbi:MAG TPA: mycothiol conjugate amidase Mca [Acidimicrobiales bacterium]|nr:mycothiol conjugate amidase Mca [Acidimicrobiales bacterium]
MNYDFEELTPEVVRGVGFRERYRGYDPSDVDPLLEQLALAVEEIHQQIEQIEHLESTDPTPAPRVDPDLARNVAALTAMLHIGYAARDARNIVNAARAKTGIKRPKDEVEVRNEERARALIYAPRPEGTDEATTLTDMDSPRCILTVHAHPDDEASKGAGTIAKYHAEGVRTVLVCCTGGEEGDILNPAMDTDEVRADIGAVRRRELEAAAKVIGYDEVVLLGYRDSGMPDSDANKNPACFASAPIEEAVGRLVAELRRTRPQVVVTYGDKQERYPHPDHLRVHEVTMAAVDAAADPLKYPDTGEPWQVSKIYYTAWSFKRIVLMHEKFLEMGLESPFDENWFKDRKPDETDSETTTQIDLRGFEDVRQNALLAHATQIDPTSKFWFGLPPEVMRDIHPYDDYVLARGPRGDGEVETDLFAGLVALSGRA